MTKSLTEQWKDMDLGDEHLYYWRMPNGEVRIMSKMGVCSYKLCYDGGEIDILAPVPSYDEFVQQRDFVKDHQKVLIENMNLKLKIERLQEQLSDANKALKQLVGFGVVTEETKAEYEDPDDWECTDVAQEYLDKWGVK